MARSLGIGNAIKRAFGGGPKPIDLDKRWLENHVLTHKDHGNVLAVIESDGRGFKARALGLIVENRGKDTVAYQHRKEVIIAGSGYVPGGTELSGHPVGATLKKIIHVVPLPPEHAVVLNAFVQKELAERIKQKRVEQLEEIGRTATT